MARTAKTAKTDEVVQYASVIEAPFEGADEVEAVEEVVAPKVAPVSQSKTKYVITASYKTRTLEGERVVHKFEGTGASIAEALDTLVGSEEDMPDELGKPFPQRVNLLVNVTVKYGEYRFDRAIAPQVTESIFTHRNVALVKKLFGV
jgi:hypothetical protein